VAVGFDGIPFGVSPDGDAFVPLPAGPDNDNQPRSLSVTARFRSGSDLSDMRGKRSRVTVLPMMGSAAGGTLVIEGGEGVRSLTYATAGGAELTTDAILVYVSPTAQLLNDEYRCDLRFLIVE
jgi:hypothetical protein